VTGWVASLKHNELTNWDICKREGLFGTGSPRGSGVREGDVLFVWWARHGLIARARILEDSRGPRSVAEIPWPDPQRYKYLFAIEVTDEVTRPLTISWKQLDELAAIGQVPASQLPPVRPEHVPKVDLLFTGASPQEAAALHHAYRHGATATTRYRPAGLAKTTTERRPFDVDPDSIDRGLNGHRQTQDALAAWLSQHGVEPLSPAGAPNFDIAWRRGNELFVGEVKSLTPENEPHQIRLAIGQVLEYAYRLSASPVVILERPPTDDIWQFLTRTLSIQLVWPGTFGLLTERATLHGTG
jgi:hypothetical protein